MARDLSKELEAVHFTCGECRHKFESAPGRIEDYPERETHPWRYFAECPECRAEAGQAWWEQNLMKAYGRQTGPRTPEGKARSIANLDGYPTVEQRARTRFNGLKHGGAAKVKTFFPARPGQYPFCDSCEVPFEVCGRNQYCITQTGHMMNILEAFEKRDPNLLRDMFAQKQAHFQAILDMAILAIIKRGVEIQEPVWYKDDDGNVRLAQAEDEFGRLRQLTEIKAHPLLKFVVDSISKNNMSLSDMGMTPKAQDEDALLKGHLDSQQESAERLAEFQAKNVALLEQLRERIESSRAGVRRASVVIDQDRDS